MQQRECQSDPTITEFGLKGQHLLGQRIVLRLMFSEIRILVQPHESLFVGEVPRGVLDESLQYACQHSLPLGRAQGRVQLTTDGEQTLMLGVDTPNVDSVFGFPFKHIEHIGGR
jgi:hypothetical protein